MLELLATIIIIAILIAPVGLLLLAIFIAILYILISPFILLEKLTETHKETPEEDEEIEAWIKENKRIRSIKEDKQK